MSIFSLKHKLGQNTFTCPDKSVVDDFTPNTPLPFNVTSPGRLIVSTPLLAVLISALLTICNSNA